MTIDLQSHIRLNRQSLTALLVAVTFIFAPNTAPLVLAAEDVIEEEQAVDASGNPTGVQGCTGAGCSQGFGQGMNNGGPTVESLGGTIDADGNIVWPEGTSAAGLQGGANGLFVGNANTGANSTNANDVDLTGSNTTNLNNTVDSGTDADIAGVTGQNTQNANTGANGLYTGDIGIGVTQVINDNTAVVGGTAGLNVDAHGGDYNGDLNLGFSAGDSALTGDGSGLGSVTATNEVTGSESDNTLNIFSSLEDILEVQNDGVINNDLDILADSGNNEASMNTGGGTIVTGDADISATLVNLLNTTVIGGDLWITVQDIFGNLNGDIHIDALASYMSAAAQQSLAINAANGTTGAGSNNDIDIDLTEREETNITNDADITTDFDLDAITGENTASMNTDGADIATGDAHVQGSNITVANTTVEGGNWGIFIVNALNGWLGFMVGDNGSVAALSQDETIAHLDAQNNTTGADSNNEIDIDSERTTSTNVDNTAVITNDVSAAAITGQNEASKNTGGGVIDTGDATVQATAVNIANTTVKDGSLFIAVVNVFGDWFGDLFYDNSSLAAQATAGGGQEVSIDGLNTNTGSESDNTIDVGVNLEHETNIDNDADLAFNLDANVETGGNTTNKNTQGTTIDTGVGSLAMNSRTVANFTGLAGEAGLTVSMAAENNNTGYDSKNRVRAEVNSERIVAVVNDADVSTFLASLVNTGNNEASKNTGGADITTGDAVADVAIENLINQVIAALTNAGTTINADFANLFTGANDSLNSLTVNHDVLLSILNQANVENILDLILNTGGNAANENTGGGNISSGGVGGTHIASGANCVSASLATTANGSEVRGFTGRIIDSVAEVVNAAGIHATSGGNTMDRNTGGQTDSVGTSADCNKLALDLPEGDEPEEPDEEEHQGTQSSGSGGGTTDSDERVAAATTTPKTDGGQILRRFPVAGGDSLAQLTAGGAQFPFMALAGLAALLMASAWHFDRRARQQLVAEAAVAS